MAAPSREQLGCRYPHQHAALGAHQFWTGALGCALRK